MSKKMVVSEPLKPPAAEPTPTADLDVEIREAIDIVQSGKVWQVVVLSYHGDLCAKEVLFESQSGPEAAAKFASCSARKSFLARSGASHPEGDSLLVKVAQ